MKQNKSAFIRSMPLGMQAKEVVKAARAKDMVIKENTVYDVRSEMRKAKRVEKSRVEPTLRDLAKAAHSEGKGLTVRVHPTQEESAARFIAEVRYLGIIRARELLDNLEDNKLGA